MIFVDTSFFFPLLSAHDRDHPRVREVLESLGNRRLPELLLTTNHVVGESGGTCRRPGVLREASRRAPEARQMSRPPRAAALLRAGHSRRTACRAYFERDVAFVARVATR